MKRPYPSYRRSGVEWFGDVPAHWRVTRLSRVIRCLDGRRIPLNAEQRAERQGQYPYWGANGILDHLDGWLFNEPIVLLGEDGAPFFATNKRVAFPVSGKVWVNNHAHVLRPTHIHQEFLAHNLNITDYAAFIDGSTRDKLTQGDMNGIPVLLPPRSEQQTIAAFLDHETAQIDALITKKQQLIERLAEYRTALITRTVTRGLPPDAAEAAGLNPAPSLKASGVEWLGDVPEHWEVAHLRWFVERIKTGTTPPSINMSELAGDDIAWFSPGDIGSVLQVKQPSRTLANRAVVDGFTPLFRAESTLIVGIGATTGRVGHNSEPSTGNQQLTCVVGNDRVFPRFLSWYLWAHTQVIRVIVPFATLPILNNEFLLSLPFVAPSLREQQAIATFLDEQTEQIDVVCSRVEDAIERLQEYRTALITAAVTGKIDVREQERVKAGVRV